MGLWPQWRSALVWDFWAIISYLLFSILFFYVSLMPDLATMRDRARSHWGKSSTARSRSAGAAPRATGRGCRSAAATMAALGVPLVCSVHSIVGLGFRGEPDAGLAGKIFPPYFVVGAMYSGFAMVVVLALAIRWGLDLQAIITERHFEAIGRILLMASIVMGYSYATEWFMAWYGGDRSERGLVAFEFTGAYAPLYWAMLACNVARRRSCGFRACAEPAALFVGLDRDPRGHVARAHPDRLEHALA